MTGTAAISRPVRLKACINGTRLPGEHPALPVTPDDLARDVRAVVAAGADAVHLHVKNAAGADTLDGSALAEVLAAVRACSPCTPIGVTTGAWTHTDVRDRLAAISGWTSLPDFASVNWHEEGADAVAEALLGLGVGVEAGLWHPEAAHAWAASPVRDRCQRVLVELSDGLDARSIDADATVLWRHVHDEVGDDIPMLLHGEGTSAWASLRWAGRRGLAARIGLEDVLQLPNGSLAPDNAALVRAARAELAHFADTQP